MIFYRYIYYRIYKLFESINAKNAHNSALGILSVPLMLLAWKVHSMLSKYLWDHRLTFSEIAIPYLLVFFGIYTLNYFLLQKNSRFLETEGLFDRTRRPEFFDPLLIGVVVLIAVVLII